MFVSWDTESFLASKEKTCSSFAQDDHPCSLRSAWTHPHLSDGTAAPEWRKLFLRPLLVVSFAPHQHRPKQKRHAAGAEVCPTATFIQRPSEQRRSERRRRSASRATVGHVVERSNDADAVSVAKANGHHRRRHRPDVSATVTDDASTATSAAARAGLVEPDDPAGRWS